MSRTHRAIAVDHQLPLTPATLLIDEIARRPGIAQQLGTAAYQQLLAVVVSPDTAVVNRIWAETQFPGVFKMLLVECPQHRDRILEAQRSVYQGPREVNRYVACPWCGDTAEITGPGTADCMTCGPVIPRRTR